MVKSSATTVQEYLDQLPEDRRAVIAAVRDVILRNLPEGYQESAELGHDQLRNARSNATPTPTIASRSRTWALQRKRIITRST